MLMVGAGAVRLPVVYGSAEHLSPASLEMGIRWALLPDGVRVVVAKSGQVVIYAVRRLRAGA